MRTAPTIRTACALVDAHNHETRLRRMRAMVAGDSICAVGLHRHRMRQDRLFRVFHAEREIKRRIVHVQMHLGMRAFQLEAGLRVVSGFRIAMPCRVFAFIERSVGISSTSSGVPW